MKEILIFYMLDNFPAKLRRHSNVSMDENVAFTSKKNVREVTYDKTIIYRENLYNKRYN